MAVPILRPGPYTDDGSVVGQTRPPSSTGAGAAAAAAAAAAGAYYDDDFVDEAEEEFEYDDDIMYDGEYVAVEDATAAAGAVGNVPESWHRQQQQLEKEPASAAVAEAAGAAADLQEQQQAEEEEELGSFKEQLKELLVEELVHDVEDLAMQGDAAATAAILRGTSPTASTSPTALVTDMEAAAGDVTASLAAGSAVGDAATGAVLSEQELREAAEQQVEKLVGQQQGNAAAAAAEGATEQQ
jgi:hypothetical protein